jgi:hypothetical protein
MTLKPINEIDPHFQPPVLDKDMHRYSPRKVRWAVLMLMLLAALIFVWWAAMPTLAERAAADATATAVAAFTAAP